MKGSRDNVEPSNNENMVAQGNRHGSATAHRRQGQAWLSTAQGLLGFTTAWTLLGRAWALLSGTFLVLRLAGGRWRRISSSGRLGGCRLKDGNETK